MEDLGLRALHRRVAGIDVRRMLHVVTVLIEQADGSMQRHTREFGGFRRDCRALAAWLAELGVELVVMGEHGHLLEERARPPGERRHPRLGGQCAHDQARTWAQDLRGFLAHPRRN